MNEAIKVLQGRRSIRKYKSQQISEETLQQILAAGLCAPSAMNRQPVKIIVLQNPEEIAKLSVMNASYTTMPGDPFYAAPTVLIVLAEAGNKNGIKDGSLVMGNLMNAAYALGVGSCWINRAEEVFNSDEGKDLLKKWGVEGEYVGVGNCILGYTDDEPAMKPRRENTVVYVR